MCFTSRENGESVFERALSKFICGTLLVLNWMRKREKQRKKTMRTNEEETIDGGAYIFISRICEFLCKKQKEEKLFPSPELSIFIHKFLQNIFRCHAIKFYYLKKIIFLTISFFFSWKIFLNLLIVHIIWDTIECVMYNWKIALNSTSLPCTHFFSMNSSLE